jgi:hypothetical protein
VQNHQVGHAAQYEQVQPETPQGQPGRGGRSAEVRDRPKEPAQVKLRDLQELRRTSCGRVDWDDWSTAQGTTEDGSSGSR